MLYLIRNNQGKLFVPEAPQLTIENWSKNRILRGLQMVWEKSDVPLSQIIKEGPVARSKAYAMLVHGHGNPTVETLQHIARVLKVDCEWVKRETK